jgi:hypothetical protein
MFYGHAMTGPGPTVWRTIDGLYRVYVYPDHTAELTNDRGVLLMKRQAMYKVTDRLIQIDDDYTELVCES